MTWHEVEEKILRERYNGTIHHWKGRVLSAEVPECAQSVLALHVLLYGNRGYVIWKYSPTQRLKFCVEAKGTVGSQRWKE